MKGDLLVHDVYGPVYFETMTVQGASIVRVFAVDQAIFHTTKQHLRCATAHERELVFAQLSVPLQYGEGVLVDGIPDMLCLAHGYTETGTVTVVLFTSEMVEPVEKHFVAAHLVQVSARHYPAIQCCVLSAAIQCCVLSVCVPVRVLPCHRQAVSR